MTISGTIGKDNTYPMKGDAVTLRVTGLTSGNRVRWRLLSAPALSKLETYDAQEPTVGWLDARVSNGAIIVPDTHGEFVLEAVEEEFAAHIPHFAGDPTGAAEEWVETATEEYSVFAGTEAERTFGDGQHTITMTSHVIAVATATQGVVTAWYNRDRCPKLHSPSSDLAELALADPTVQEILTYYGGKGYPYGSAIISVDSAFSLDPRPIMGKLSIAFNRHRGYTANGVHGTADVTNVMSSVAAPTDLSSLCSYTNTFVTNILAHAALGATTHPNGADTSVSFASASATTLSTAVTRIREIAAQYALHRVRGGELTPTVHSSPGDAIPDNRGPWYELPLDATVDQAIDYVVELAGAYDGHLGTTTVAATYHAAADADNEVVESAPINDADLIYQVNTFADYLEAHATNMVASTHAAAGSHYHGTVGTPIPDLGCKVPMRASDKATAVQTLDMCLWAYLHHVDKDHSWHGGLNAGKAHVNDSIGCTTRLQVAILDRLAGEATATIPNLLTAVEHLVSYGAFRIV